MKSLRSIIGAEVVTVNVPISPELHWGYIKKAKLGGSEEDKVFKRDGVEIPLCCFDGPSITTIMARDYGSTDPKTTV